nr:inner membrane protein YpjD [Oxalobacteraceae bacterium]
MQLLLIHVAGLLYVICALLPAQQRKVVAIGTLLAWVLHGVSLAAAVIAPDHLRLGFAVMLSAALWMSVGAYWFENRNMSVDGLRRMVLPAAALTIVLPIIFPGTE